MESTPRRTQRKKSVKRKRKPQAAAGTSSSGLSLKLPVFQQLGTLSARLRFVTPAALSQGLLQILDLLNSVAVATSSTAVQPIFFSVRLKKIALYTATNTGTEGAEALNILWATSQNSSAVTTSSQLGVLPGALIRSPPALLKLWQTREASAQSTIFCKLTCPADSIIDLYFDAVLLTNTTTAIAAVTGLSGLTAGIVYAGLLIGSTVCDPQGVLSYL